MFRTKESAQRFEIKLAERLADFDGRSWIGRSGAKAAKLEQTYRLRARTIMAMFDALDNSEKMPARERLPE